MQEPASITEVRGQAKIETTTRYAHPEEQDILEISSAVQQALLKDSLQFSLQSHQEAIESGKM